MLTQDHRSPNALFESFFLRSAPGKLTLDAFPHVTRYVELLDRYLTSALARRVKGANVLVHGPPRCGKTELVRALARATKAELHEVRSDEPTEGSFNGSQRSSAYQLCQHMLARAERAIPCAGPV